MMSEDSELINQPAEEQAARQDGQGQIQAEEADEVQTLREQLAQAQAQAAEYLDNWRRTAAELSNARKRMQREAEEYRATAAVRVLEKLLPIADDITRAFENLPADQADSEWVNGFRLIQRKLEQLLESEGVSAIETEGQNFDPALHYAVTHEDAEGFSEGQIIAEVSRGYRLGDRVLRPSMVRVAK
ncbi:MAG: nucleotide exchange factor GrpE [Anaerolineae bacterium]